MSFGILRQRILLKCVPLVQHDYFVPHSTNQIVVVVVGLFVCYLRVVVIITKQLPFPKCLFSSDVFVAAAVVAAETPESEP